jgi:hypothetical protein
LISLGKGRDIDGELATVFSLDRDLAVADIYYAGHNRPAPLILEFSIISWPAACLGKTCRLSENTQYRRRKHPTSHASGHHNWLCRHVKFSLFLAVAGLGQSFDSRKEDEWTWAI